MIQSFGGSTSSGARNANWRFIRIIAVAALAALLVGCAGYPTQADFKDSHKSLVLMYVRYDKHSPIALWAHIRHPGSKDDVALVWVDSGKKNPECSLYVAAIPSGVYEFSAFSSENLAYRFPETSKGNFSLRVGNRQGIYMLGRFQMHAFWKTAGTDKSSFSFTRTSGCPSNKVAYRTLLNNDDWKGWLKGTRWRRILKARSR